MACVYRIKMRGGPLAGGQGALLSSILALPYARPMDQDTDDAALMQRYRTGDMTAFEALYRRNKDSLYRYLLRLTLDRDTAEEVFQDAWGKVVNARDAYRPTARFRTYLFRVAHNCFIDHLRRNRRHRQPADADPDLEISPDPDPEALAERELMRRRLEQALRELPTEQRDAWLLHEEGDLTTEQIAEITGVNRETAKSRVRYAARKLRASLATVTTAGTAGAPARTGAGKVGTS
jgi:RNA polymerase sigma-70 factor (ECF subfamily)